MNTCVKAGVSFLLTALILCSTTAWASNEGELVPAHYHSTVYFGSHHSGVRVALIGHGMTTLNFRVYDKALHDIPVQTGHFDGKPGGHPRVITGTHIGNPYRDGVTLTFSSPGPSSENIRNLRVLPVYQTTDGLRIYYVTDSFHETRSGDKLCKFFVFQPVGGQ